jgi:hypothetical protein
VRVVPKLEKEGTRAGACSDARGIHNVVVAKSDTQHNLALESNIARALQRCHSQLSVPWAPKSDKKMSSLSNGQNLKALPVLVERERVFY